MKYPSHSFVLEKSNDFINFPSNNKKLNSTKLKVFADEKSKSSLRYQDPEDRVFDRVVFDISVVQRETILTISDSIEKG